VNTTSSNLESLITCRRCGGGYVLSRTLLPACPHCGASPISLWKRFKIRHNGLGAILALLALITLSISLFLPFLSMTKLGETRVFSMIGGIFELFERREYLIGAVLLTFSVIFPFMKLLGLLAATSSLVPLSPRGRILIHKIAVVTGKYSLLDILVVAIIIVTVKFRNLVEASAMPGTTVFCCAILLSMLSGLAVNLDHVKEKTV
jgi:paraquat-inducible protein A